MSTLTESSPEPPLSTGVPSGARWAEGLWRASMALLALMPVGMTVAHRSSPLFLGLSAAFALAAAGAEGRLGEVCRQAARALRTPLGGAALAFLAWSLLSVGWSEVPETSAYAVSEFWLPVAFAFVLSLLLPAHMTRQAFWILVAAVGLSQLLMLMDLRSGLALRKALGMRWDSYIFNRPSLTLLVLLPALVAWISGHVRPGRALSATLATVVGLAVVRSDSGAAVLGLAFGAVIFGIAWLAPRAASWMLRLALVGSLALAPVFGPLADGMISDALHHAFARNHSRDRVDIWLSFDAAIREQPIAGAGFGASARLDETSVAERVPPEHRVLLAVGHPHNAPIQVWVDLGVVGAVLAGAVGLLVLRRLDRLERRMRALSFALMGAILAVGMVGHGAWQGWWAAAIGAAIVWLRAAHRPQGYEPQEKVP